MAGPLDPLLPPDPPLATSLGLLTWRPRIDADLALVRALFASSREAELAHLPAEGDVRTGFVDLQLRARDQHRDATRPGAVLGIITVDDIAVGQLDLHRNGDAVEVLEVALVPGLRGHGLGTSLLGHLVAGAAAEGSAVRLHVEPVNPARHLYERLGFVVTGTEGRHLAMERPAPGGLGGSAAAVPAAPAPTAAAATANDGTFAVPDLPPFPTYDDLAPHLGAAVGCGTDSPDLVLVEIEPRRRASPSGRVPYVAVFAGPPDARLAQGLHRLDLPGVGPTDVFLVPIAPVGGRPRYEMVVT